MRIGRTLPPAAAPIPWSNIFRALLPLFSRSKRPDETFETELKAHFGMKYCFLLSSGKSALTLILKALHKVNPDGEEVVIPAFTCFSVPASIKKAGLKIRLCDLEPSSLNYNSEHLAEIIATDQHTGKILCLIATHFFGCPTDVTTLQKIIGTTIPMVEDAAQSMGESFLGMPLGTIGDIGFFSLGRGKALSLIEGGIILTNRDDLGKIIEGLVEELPYYNRLEMIKLLVKAVLTNMLQHPQLYWLPKALPFLKLGETLYEDDFAAYRLSPFQRKLARNWYVNLQALRRVRTRNNRFWQDKLPIAFTRPYDEKSAESLIRLPLLAQTPAERDRIITLSNLEGLGIMPAYPNPIHKIRRIADEFLAQTYPQADKVCGRLFTLPVHQFITDGDRRKIEKLLADPGNPTAKD